MTDAERKAELERARGEQTAAPSAPATEPDAPKPVRCSSCGVLFIGKVCPKCRGSIVLNINQSAPAAEGLTEESAATVDAMLVRHKQELVDLLRPMFSLRSPQGEAMTATPKLKKGEINVGITLHDGKPHHLILLAGDEKKNWKNAVAWAKKKGGELPSCIDGSVLFKNLRAELQRDWYWTNEEVTALAGYAWVQGFGDGGTGYGHKSYDFRCRAVRRVPI